MPRISQEQKERNHQRIVESASASFRSRGVDAVGIDEVMRDAGMTHGGFYNHFASKEALAVEVCEQAFKPSLAGVAAIIEAHPRSPRAAFDATVDAYLSVLHRDHPEFGCASAALVGDSGRHDADVQGEFSRGLEGYIADFTSLLAGAAARAGTELPAEAARERAIGVFSEMVGAMVLSRAVAQASPGLADEVLAANRSELRRRR